MEDFERTDLREVQTKVEDRIGFVVGGHNYGRVDKMGEQELTTIAEDLGRLMQQAGELMDAIAIQSQQKQD